MSALSSGDPGPQVLFPQWLAQSDREQLATVVRSALADGQVHPVGVLHLEDVLTELHVAAARDAVWPASAARVRMATGWGADMLPVRLSTAELTSLLDLPTLPDALRGQLTGSTGQ